MSQFLSVLELRLLSIFSLFYIGFWYFWAVFIEKIFLLRCFYSECITVSIVTFICFGHTMTFMIMLLLDNLSMTVYFNRHSTVNFTNDTSMTNTASFYYTFRINQTTRRLLPWRNRYFTEVYQSVLSVGLIFHQKIFK